MPPRESGSMLPSEGELRAFVEQSLGDRGATRIDALRRAGTGRSRVTFFVEGVDAQGAPLSLVLRCDSGDGPLSGTEIDLAHEAVIYRALRDAPVRIPRLLAQSRDGRSLLVERVAGSEAFAGIAERAQRAAIARDFAVALAELHRVDPAGLALPGVPRPRTAAEHAVLDLSRWLRILEERVPAPDALLRFAGEWLAAHPPDGVERTVLCHGDAGIGNFLHREGRVTALLDWEFAHLGDALDDVAWALVRSHLLGGADETRDALSVWSQRAGLALDPHRIAWYRGLVLLRMAVSCAVGLSHAQAREDPSMDTATYRLLLPYLGFLLPQALREAGCRGAALDALGERAVTEMEAVPVLKAMARPLEAVAAAAGNAGA